MKRFYCTVCKKVKRVQKWPIIIENISSTDVNERIGVCNRHTMTTRKPITKSFRELVAR